MNKRSGWITFFAVWQFIEAIICFFLAVGALQPRKSVDLSVGIFLIIFGCFSIPVGFGLLKLKNWARVTLIIKSIPELFFIPIGTVIAGITIYYFTRRKSKAYFTVELAIKGSVPRFSTVPFRFLLIFQKRLTVWRFSKAWKNSCVPRRMAKDSTLVKCLIALEKNNRKKARKIWESLQRHFPKDYRVTHSLALLNYWEAVSAKNPKSLNNETIGKTIGNWVMLLNSDDFWDAWRKEREPFYFQDNISNNQIEDLRRDLKSQLENTVPDAHQNALSLELKTAELLCNVAEWGKKKGLDSRLLRAGPITLKQFGVLGKARYLALFGLQVEPENNDFKLLSLYLSPLGIAVLFLRGERVEDALNELGKIENRNRWMTKEFEAEFVNAVINWANQAQNDDESIRRFQRALNLCYRRLHLPPLSPI